MPAQAAVQKEENTGAARFPLVGKLVHFADIRRHYKQMREALIASNRQKGSYKGWVTKWKNKYEASELDRQKVEIEAKQLTMDNRVLADQIRDMSNKFTDMGSTLAKLEAFESAVDHLAEMNHVANDQKRAAGYWSANAMDDLSNSVSKFLQTVDEILNEEIAPGG